MKWSPNGNSLILIGKDQFCVTYFQNDDENTENS